jgi:hypothetical protein
VEPVRIEPGGEAVPRTYVECLIGADSKPFGFYAARARDRGWDCRSLNSGHDAMVTAPEDVARLLLELGETSGRTTYRRIHSA